LITEFNFKPKKTLIMKGFATSPMNYTSGLRPRRFFAATKRRMRMDIILGKKQKTALVSKPIRLARA
jgi:hypothetical protein